MLKELIMALVLHVSPQTGFAPATLHVAVHVEEGASLRIEVFGENYGTESIALIGERHEFVWDYRRVPAGEYEVRATTFTPEGKVLHSTAVTVMLAE